MNKKNDQSFSVLVKICITIVILFLLMAFIRPFGGKIAQDRPLVKLGCGLQLGCHVDKSSVGCEQDGRVMQENVNLLEQYVSYYRGCNANTSGYGEEVVGVTLNKFISGIDYCGCGGFMS